MTLISTRHLQAALAHAGVQPQRCAFFSSTAVRAVDTARLVMEALEVSAMHGFQVSHSS